MMTRTNVDLIAKLEMMKPYQVGKGFTLFVRSEPDPRIPARLTQVLSNSKDVIFFLEKPASIVVRHDYDELWWQFRVIVTGETNIIGFILIADETLNSFSHNPLFVPMVDDKEEDQ